MIADDLAATVTDIAARARAASLELARLPTPTKNAILETLAGLIEANKEELLGANAHDIRAAEQNGLAAPMIERLTFDDARIARMAEGVRQIAALEDPTGAVLETTVRPNGLKIDKVRVPIGVIGIIYESRPNVTIDCAALCLKSGNASILRGGKEAFHSNTCLAGLVRQALEACEVNPDMVQLIPTTDREALKVLLSLDAYVHCIIPRGGKPLIEFVAGNSRIPVIKHYLGVCSVYVDKDCDPDMAEAIVLNAKTQRVSVCNAIENLYVHRAHGRELFPRICRKLQEAGVKLLAHESAAKWLEKANYGGVLIADTEIDFDIVREDAFYEEYLDYKIAIMVVDNADDAIAAINTYGSAHSDAIVTSDEATAQQFLAGVDSATVYWNASTRFTDGYEFGLGAEIGISTDRLHARGPMGLNELCTYKYRITGTGQVK